MSDGTGVCRSCGALILWAKYQRTGRSAPLDGTPDARGSLSVEFVDGERVYSLCPDVVHCLHAEHWTTHFRTCPNAKTHRGTKR